MKKRLHHLVLSKYTLVLLLAIGYCMTAKAQDPRFSQFYAAPMHLNPALTGVFEGSWRATLNYRDQWASILQQEPYRTFGAGYDMRLNLVGNDYFSFGFNFLGDQAGAAHLKQTKGHLSMSYSKQLSGGGYNLSQQYLVAGVQAGFGQHKQDYGGLWFTDQFDLSSENLDLSQGSIENLNGSTAPYFDVNVGLLWYALFDDNLSLYAGGSINHINGPEIALNEGDSYILPTRWVGHVGGEIPLNPELSLMPAVAIMGQSGGNSFTFGTNVRYNNHDWRELAIRMGAWLHLSNTVTSLHSDAITFAMILELDRFNFGISYDINTSVLKAATNSRGTVELSFIYVHPEEKRVRVHCPNF